MFLFRALAFMAAGAASAALADDSVNKDSPAAPVNPPIHVSAGDSWTYDMRDDVTGDVKGTVEFAVTKTTDAEFEVRETVVRQATGAKQDATEIFDTRWRLKDNGKVVFRPRNDDNGVPDDLSVGKSWSFKYQVLRKGAAVGQELAGGGKVEAWERVKLRNGASYDAFRIDVKFVATLPGNQHKRETHSVMWYAPTVNRLVKRTDEIRDNGKLLDSSEMTLREYKPAKKS